MKKLSPFMLVRHVNLQDNDSGAVKTRVTKGAVKLSGSKVITPDEIQAKLAVNTILSSSSLLSKTFESLNPALRQTLIDAYRGVDVSRAATQKAPRNAGRPSKKGIATKLSGKGRTTATPASGKNVARSSLKDWTGAAYVEQITRDLSRATDPLRIGILDLGAWIAGLPDLLVRLNAAQDLVTLFEVNAPVPAGLKKTAKGLAEWFDRHGVKLGRGDIRGLEPHLVFEDFFHVASDIRTNMGLDMIVGLIPVMVAGEVGDTVYWNHFSNVQDGVILISTTDVREFAAEAGRPFEAAVGSMLIGAVLVGLNEHSGYHYETRGCLFDYNEDRSGLANAIRMTGICPACAEVLSAEQRSAAESMLKVLRKMKGRGT